MKKFDEFIVAADEFRSAMQAVNVQYKKFYRRGPYRPPYRPDMRSKKKLDKLVDVLQESRKRLEYAAAQYAVLKRR